MSAEQEMKTCSKCGEEKPLDAFSFDKRGKSGRASCCKQCSRNYRAENKERISERKKQHYAENRDRICEYMKQYRDENRDSIKERQKKYYAKYYANNKDRICEYIKQYRDENSDSIYERQRQYYATYSANNKERLSEYERNRCNLLPDGHVATLIARRSGINQKEVPRDLIELKREQLLMYRATKQLIKSIKEKQDVDE